MGYRKGEALVETTLRELCEVFGLCLRPDALDEMRNTPLDDLDEWTRAVFRNEGLDAPHERLWEQVRAHVQRRLGSAGSSS